MSKSARHCVRLVIASVVFYIIAMIVTQLAAAPFQHYVRMFYPVGTSNSRCMQAIAVGALMLQPACWYSSCLGVIYAAIRSRPGFGFPVIPVTSGVIASFYGWASSAYVHDDPGPNYSTHSVLVPFWCLIGTIVGSCIWLKFHDSSRHIRQE